MTIAENREKQPDDPKSPKDNPDKDVDPAEQQPENEKNPHHYC